MKKKILTLGMVLALLAVLVMPTAALAVSTTEVTGTLATYYTVTAPGGFGMTITPASGGASGSLTLAVATNEITNTAVEIKVKGSVKAGFLTSAVATPLSSALSLDGASLTATTLTATDQVLLVAGTLVLVGAEMTWEVTDLVITQPAFTAVAAGAYTETITFTATFSNS